MGKVTCSSAQPIGYQGSVGRVFVPRPDGRGFKLAARNLGTMVVVVGITMNVETAVGGVLRASKVLPKILLPLILSPAPIAVVLVS